MIGFMINFVFLMLSFAFFFIPIFIIESHSIYISPKSQGKKSILMKSTTDNVNFHYDVYNMKTMIKKNLSQHH